MLLFQCDSDTLLIKSRVGVYVSSLWAQVDLYDCLDQQSGRSDTIWVGLGHKNAKHVCFVFLKNSLWWKLAAMSALTQPCREEGQTHLCGEMTRRSPETKYREGCSAIPQLLSPLLFPLQLLTVEPWAHLFPFQIPYPQKSWEGRKWWLSF